MNFDEYREKLESFEVELENKKQKLAIEYALTNNPVKVGDIVTDHCHTIKVEKIQIHFLKKPQCVYLGSELNKTGSIKKNPNNNTLFQCNLESINGVTI